MWTWFRKYLQCFFFFRILFTAERGVITVNSEVRLEILHAVNSPSVESVEAELEESEVAVVVAAAEAEAALRTAENVILIASLGLTRRKLIPS